MDAWLLGSFTTFDRWWFAYGFKTTKKNESSNHHDITANMMSCHLNSFDVEVYIFPE